MGGVIKKEFLIEFFFSRDKVYSKASIRFRTEFRTFRDASESTVRIFVWLTLIISGIITVIIYWHC